MQHHRLPPPPVRVRGSASHQDGPSPPSGRQQQQQQEQHGRHVLPGPSAMRVTGLQLVLELFARLAAPLLCVWPCARALLSLPSVASSLVRRLLLHSTLGQLARALAACLVSGSWSLDRQPQPEGGGKAARVGGKMDLFWNSLRWVAGMEVHEGAGEGSPLTQVNARLWAAALHAHAPHPAALGGALGVGGI